MRRIKQCLNYSEKIMCLSLKFYTQPNYESRVRGRPFSDKKGIKKLASHEDVLRNLLQDALQQNER